MTNKQVQCLLTYLGYDTGGIDGVRGAKTTAALARFQADYGCGEEGLPGAVGGSVPRIADAGGSLWDEIRFFGREEFRCPCGKCGGFPVEPEEGIVREAEALRGALGKPVIIVPPDGHSGGSGVRCREYNASLKGSVVNSRHLLGKAVDFCAPGVPAAQIEAQLAARKAAGKLRYWYRIAPGSYHMDIE